MESEILRLLAGLDIGKASYVLLAVIVIWGLRQMVASLVRIERLMAKMEYHADLQRYYMGEIAAILEREGIQFRKQRPKKEARKI